MRNLCSDPKCIEEADRMFCGVPVCSRHGVEGIDFRRVLASQLEEERERCATVCEDLADDNDAFFSGAGLLREAAEMIRELGEE